MIKIVIHLHRTLKHNKMTSQTKCIEIISCVLDKKTWSYTVNYFDSNIEDSDIETVVLSEDTLHDYIIENDLNREEYINYNMRNLECDGMDERFIPVDDYLDNNVQKTIIDYLTTNS